MRWGHRKWTNCIVVLFDWRNHISCSILTARAETQSWKRAISFCNQPYFCNIIPIRLEKGRGRPGPAYPVWWRISLNSVYFYEIMVISWLNSISVYLHITHSGIFWNGFDGFHWIPVFWTRLHPIELGALWKSRLPGRHWWIKLDFLCDSDLLWPVLLSCCMVFVLRIGLGWNFLFDVLYGGGGGEKGRSHYFGRYDIEG